jgi:hypothetical protein
MLPFLIGAVLVGAAYFGALGVSKHVLGPTESLAAPTDAPVLLLNESAPAHISAEPWFEPMPDQPAHHADQATRELSGVPQAVPHMTSPETSQTPAVLTLLDAPTMAPLEGASDLATTPTEAMEQWGAHNEEDVDATPVPELGASAPIDGAAGGEPMAVYVEPSVADSAYGPQS